MHILNSSCFHQRGRHRPNFFTLAAVFKNLHCFFFSPFKPLGTRDSHQHGLRCGSPPLGRLPGAHAAVRRLEEGVGHQGDQHGGVSSPQARPLPARFHPQRHQRKSSSLSTVPRYLITSDFSSSSISVCLVSLLITIPHASIVLQILHSFLPVIRLPVQIRYIANPD